MRAYGWTPSEVDKQDLETTFDILVYDEEQEKEADRWHIVEPWEDE